MVAGLILLFGGLALKIVQGDIYSFNSLPPQTKYSKNDSARISPARIKIAKINLDLPVIETKIQNGIWQIDKNGISHLQKSGVIGQNGNIILYGHNSWDRLGNLSKVSVGDSLEVIGSDDKRYYYIVQSTNVVSPSFVQILSPTGGQEVTIYTCYGFADLKRFVVKAKRLFI